MALEVPNATQNAPCPLCGDAAGIVVGEQGRFGMPVRNLCCATCATVYVTPRPTAAAMGEYYRSTYRNHYGGVSYVGADGKSLAVGQEGYEQALFRWHQQQANNALALVSLTDGAKVLEVGCRSGQTLKLMRERHDIEAFGVEPGEDEAEQARQAGVACFTGTLEDFEPGERRFDHVQWFHVLEHMHEPLAALLKLRSLLEPSGTLLIEVPNVYQPYGLLEENFFQNVHLVSYSPNTLPALLRRAGFDVTRVVDGGSLFTVATPRALAAGASLPAPYAPELLSVPEQDARWVAARLRTYATLEKLQLLFKHRGASPELTGTLVGALDCPEFPGHLAEACAFFVKQLLARGMLDDALQVTLAVAQGPHPLELRHQFRNFAERLGAPSAALATAV